jgi:hypothetical protein
MKRNSSATVLCAIAKGRAWTVHSQFRSKAQELYCTSKDDRVPLP